MRFYRYQGTNTIEAKSRYVDLNLLHEDLEIYKDKFNTIEELHEYLCNKYESSLQLREGISAKELFEKVVSAADSNEVDEMTYSYPVTGIFGVEATDVDESYYLDDLLDECPWVCENDKFLVLYEGRKITSFGDDGTVFEPHRIITIWERNRT